MNKPYSDFLHETRKKAVKANKLIKKLNETFVDDADENIISVIVAVIFDENEEKINKLVKNNTK